WRRLRRRRRQLEDDARAVAPFRRRRSGPREAPHRAVADEHLRGDEVELVFYTHQVDAAADALLRFVPHDADVAGQPRVRLDARIDLAALLGQNDGRRHELRARVDAGELERLEATSDDAEAKMVLDRRNAVRSDGDANVVGALVHLLPAGGV